MLTKPIMRAVSILLLVVALSLPAATLESLTVEEMTQQATAVVRGRIGEARSTRVGALVYTMHQLEVLEQWTGKPLSTLEVAIPGGTFEGVTYRFGGTPEFAPGGEYILFLWTGPSGRTQIVGLTQGVFRVWRQGEQTLAARTAAANTVFVGGDNAQDKQGIEMPLSGLVARILSATGETTDR